MAQSKADSKKEIRLNIGTGFVLSWALTTFLMYAGAFEALNSFAITCIFTVVSYYRSYFFRRWYNQKTLLKMAKNGESLVVTPTA